nr:MAG TPA: hypothetical protein [Caudoviricetes sp.]
MINLLDTLHQSATCCNVLPDLILNLCNTVPSNICLVLP